MCRVELAHALCGACPSKLPRKLIHALDLTEAALVEACVSGQRSNQSRPSPKLADEKVSRPEHMNS